MGIRAYCGIAGHRFAGWPYLCANTDSHRDRCDGLTACISAIAGTVGRGTANALPAFVQRVSQYRVCPDPHFRVEHLFHRCYLVLILPLFGYSLPLGQNTRRHYLPGRTAAGDRQSDLQHRHRIGQPECGTGRGGRFAGLSGGYPQAGVFPECGASLAAVSPHARFWELLLAMLLLEAIFGLQGIVAAPVFYAYIKDELKAVRWI